MTVSWIRVCGQKFYRRWTRGGCSALYHGTKLPTGAAVSLRFPLSQLGKVRPSDNLSQCQVNSTVYTCEHAMGDGPDVICGYATYLVRCLEGQGFSTCLRGRSLDLTSAYRQLAIADASLQHSYLSAYDPFSGSAKPLHQVALPFWPRYAVNVFTRCARFFNRGLMPVFSFFLDLLL